MRVLWVVMLLFGAGCVSFTYTIVEPDLVYLGESWDDTDPVWLLHVTGCGSCGFGYPHGSALVVRDSGIIHIVEFIPTTGPASDVMSSRAFDLAREVGSFHLRDGPFEALTIGTFEATNWNAIQATLQRAENALGERPGPVEHLCEDVAEPVIAVEGTPARGGEVMVSSECGGNVSRDSAWGALERQLAVLHRMAQDANPWTYSYESDTTPPTAILEVFGPDGKRAHSLQLADSFTISAASIQDADLAAVVLRIGAQEWLMFDGQAFDDVQFTGVEGLHSLESYAFDRSGNVGRWNQWIAFQNHTQTSWTSPSLLLPTEDGSSCAPVADYPGRPSPSRVFDISVAGHARDDAFATVVAYVSGPGTAVLCQDGAQVGYQVQASPPVVGITLANNEPATFQYMVHAERPGELVAHIEVNYPVASSH